MLNSHIHTVLPWPGNDKAEQGFALLELIGHLRWSGCFRKRQKSEVMFVKQPALWQRLPVFCALFVV
ncbi:MAG: hypothetical protein E6X17_00245 [Sporomusaceae bacterium]|nr:hypothetical protein [Sporomusaceae bacterium]